MLIGLTVRRAAFTLAVRARAAFGATVAAGVIPRLLCCFAVIAVNQPELYFTQNVQFQSNKIKHAVVTEKSPVNICKPKQSIIF